jgi:formylglycine-generating enzyme required for sulfatase activity
MGLEGPHALQADAPVYGVNYYEASAYTTWLRQSGSVIFSGVRLPHEYEWEAAAQLEVLDRRGEAWEWCGNTFHPYPGFTAFPYDGYSQAWFDGNHFVLRGGSLHTRPPIGRSTFRNFYNPDKRHIFSGLRVVFG